jgi:multidrug efflux system outer membrane protein
LEADESLVKKSDLANYLEVITAQGNALQAELDLASIQISNQQP